MIKRLYQSFMIIPIFLLCIILFLFIFICAVVYLFLSWIITGIPKDNADEWCSIIKILFNKLLFIKDQS